MYFGALSIGADFTAGLLVMNLLKKINPKPGSYLKTLMLILS